MMSAEALVTATLDMHGMLDRGRRIGIAASGGADSVFLLHILHRLGLAAAVLHVNHKLRGRESDEDEDFVRELARGLNLVFHSAGSPVREGNVEQEARRARYEFFCGRIASGVCDAVATGHTLDDQAETVLSRFLRGSGTAGLRGVLPVTEQGVIRPLLGLRRDAIREWLREQKLGWREDCSNSDREFLRNRLRLEIMPQFALLNPALAETLASTADIAREEEAWWEEEIGRLARQVFDIRPEIVLFRTEDMLQRPVAIERRLLRWAVRQVRGSLRGIDFRHVEGIRAMMRASEGSGRAQLPGLDVYRSFGWMRLGPVGFDSRLERDFEAPLRIPGATALRERGLTLEMELVTGTTVYNNQMDVLDWDRCEGRLTVRNWRPGDSYEPARGRGPDQGAKKLKTLFQENRIPLWERRNWPVVVSGDAIVWSRGFGVAASFAASPGCLRAVVIRESGESNYSLHTSIQAGGSSGRVNSAMPAADAKGREARRPSEPDAEAL